MLLLFGVILGISCNSLNVLADDVETVTVPIYEMELYGPMTKDHKITDVELPIDKSHSESSYDTISQLSEIKDGAYKTDKDDVYVGYKVSNYYYRNPDDGKFYQSSDPFENQLDGFYYKLVQGKFKINFVTEDSTTGEEVNVETSEQVVDIGKNNGKPFLDDIRIPIGYKLEGSNDEKYEPGKPREFTLKLIPVDTITPLTIKYIVNGIGTTASKTIDYQLKYGETIPRKLIKLTENESYLPEIDYTKGNSIALKQAGVEAPPEEPFDSELLAGLLNETMTFENPGNAIILNLYYKYDDEKNPITYDVEIPSNLTTTQVPKVSATGKLGQKLDIKVPIVSGYKADKSTITATVGADGVIKADDNQQVTYTKESTNNNSNNHHSSGTVAPEFSDVNVNLATIQTTPIYDKYGQKIDQTKPAVTDLMANQKMLRNGITYYQVGDGQWVKATDVYLYDSQDGTLRTNSGSFKYLINSKAETVTNRGLAAGSDWYFDRTAEFNGKKYYRVATNEWTSQGDIFTYQSQLAIITTNKITDSYNGSGQKIGAIPSSQSFRTDRVALINGQDMYRIATDEYVLVSDIK